MTGFLLDTNAFLFLGFRTDGLDGRLLDALSRGRRFVSQVCAIELAIKQTVGKLDLPAPFQTSFAHAFADSVRRMSAATLMLDMRHIDRLSQLPLHHRDPFDRLIIAQALSENLTVVTRDSAFEAYVGLDLMRL